ncbi:MAG: peptidylprolyl isomerase [Rickettsiales bacterium]|jgi:hypothetical protein|nr:peptidylprolyl isomerase [Rickettsiales bacterium]
MVHSIRKTKTKMSRYLLGAFVAIFILYSLSGIVFVISSKYNIISGEGKTLHINEFFNLWNDEKQASYRPQMDARQIAYISSRDFMVNFLARLVNSKLVELEVENFAVHRPDELVLRTISEDEMFRSDGGFDFSKFENFLKKEELSELDFMNRVRELENRRFLLNVLTTTALLNETEVEVLLGETNLTKNAKIFSISRSKLGKDSSAVEEGEIRRYYDHNTQKFSTPETKKIDYVKIPDCKAAQLKRLQEIVGPRSNIRDISKAMKLKIESFGYLSEADIVNDAKYSAIVGVFSIKVGGLSRVMKVGNDAYVYSVGDSRKGYVKGLEEVRNDIVAAIQAERTLELQKKAVLGYREDYRNRKFADEVLLGRGFEVREVNRLTREKGQSYDGDFLRQLMKTPSGGSTDLFHDSGSIYFALVTGTGVLGEKEDGHVTRDQLVEKLVLQGGETVLGYYLNYLRNSKYTKMKVNHRLLDLIM